METRAIKKIKITARILLIFGLFGIADIATTDVIASSLEVNDLGIVSIIIGLMTSMIIGDDAATVVMTILSALMRMSIVWLVISFILYQKLKFLRDPSEKNKKNYSFIKKACIVLGIPFMGMILFGIAAVVFSL